MSIEDVKKCLSTTIANEYTLVNLKVEDVQELLALLKAAEVEAKAGKTLYMDAQKRCKAQALRGDTLEVERDKLRVFIESLTTSQHSSILKDKWNKGTGCQCLQCIISRRATEALKEQNDKRH